MVLGILSVMVLMAVAFAVSMRTERVAAGNYADSVRARQLVHAGLARALNDLAGQLGTNGLMSQPGSPKYVYPPWVVTNSYTTNYTNTSANKLYLLTGEATNFVPRALWAAATNADYQNAKNHWLPIVSPVDSATNGRIKYLILNCSGLLDANFVGGMTRGVGTNPMEIAVSNMPEMKSYSDFITNRTTDVRYETQEELAKLNETAFNGTPSNFTVYSHALPGYWDANASCVGTQVNLGGSVPDLIRRMSAITNAFRIAGITEEEHRNCLFRSLIDYVDSDNIPNNYGGTIPLPVSLPAPPLELPSNERIPMINEIKFYHKLTTVTRSGVIPIIRTYRYEGNITFEICWPFVNRPSDADFTFEYTIACVPSIISSASGGAVLPSEFAPLIWAGGSLSALTLPIYSDGPFILKVIPITTSTAVNLVDKQIDYIQLDYTINAKVRDTASGVYVDAIDNLTTSFRLYPQDVAGLYVEDVRDLECLDPRYNWAIGSDKYWRYIVQSFVNPAGSSLLTLSDYAAGRSFSAGDPVIVIGNPLPNTTPALIAGKTYWIASTNNGVIRIRDLTQIINFTDPGYGAHCIKAAQYVSNNSVDSLGSNNYWTLSYLSGQTNDSDPYMCVENAPLQSVAELGRLIYSYHTTAPAKTEPWKTINFFKPNSNSLLLDVFNIGGTNVFMNEVKQGLFNPNASSVDCLATVLSGAYVDDFNDAKIKNYYQRAGDTFELMSQLPDCPLDRFYFSGMPIYLYGVNALYYVIYLDHNHFKLAVSYESAITGLAANPPPGNGYLSPAKLIMTGARNMASVIAGGPYTNYSQLANALTNFNFGTDDEFPYPATELEKETLLSHNIGLLSLRQNLFAIIIEAQVASGGNFPRNPIRQRAVVLVWRDPYTGEMFNRNIIWLED